MDHNQAYFHLIWVFIPERAALCHSRLDWGDAESEKNQKGLLDSSFSLCCQTTKVNRMSGFKRYMPTSHWMMLHVYISALISSSVPVRMDYFFITFTAVHWHHDHVISVWHMLISSHLFVLGETWHFISLRLQVCTQKWCRLLSNINKLFAIIFCILVDLNADECVLWSTVRLWGGR